MLDSSVVNFLFTFLLFFFLSSILSPLVFSSACDIGPADVLHGTIGVKTVGSESQHFFEEGLFLGPTQITSLLLPLPLEATLRTSLRFKEVCFQHTFPQLSLPGGQGACLNLCNSLTSLIAQCPSDSLQSSLDVDFNTYSAF